jgi:AraC-like DNA-binding protein
MRIQDIFGIRFLRCQRRENYRTCFFGRNSAYKSDCFSLLYITRGRAEIRFGSSTLIATPGDIILWNGGAPREYRALPGHPLSYYLVILETVPGAEPKSRLSDLGLRPYYRLRRTKAMDKLFLELFRIFNGKDRLRPQKCSILGMKLLLMLEPQTGVESPAQGPDDRPADERILDTLDYINMNYKKRLSVRTLAAKAMMHRVHFTRLFKKITGFAPHRYVLEKKIVKARDFVLSYGESLTTTAVELGFHDYAHFYRVCKRITGRSPLQYLKQTGR